MLEPSRLTKWLVRLSKGINDGAASRAVSFCHSAPHALTPSGLLLKAARVRRGLGFRLPVSRDDSERSYVSILRSIPLPAELDSDKAEAMFKNGVLTIRLPQLRETKTKVKKSEVKAA